MKLQQARGLAFGIREYIRSHCEAVHVAGSIRREKAEVGDIELVVIPHYTTGTDPNNLFSEPTAPVNTLHQYIEKGIPAGNSCGDSCPEVRWIKTGTDIITPWQIKPTGKYWRGYLPRYGLKLDMFLPTFDNLGAILLIRTGNEDFSTEVVTHARRVGYRFQKGWLQRDKGGDTWETILTPDEGTVFRELGLEYVPPQMRTGRRAVRRIAK